VHFPKSSICEVKCIMLKPNMHEQMYSRYYS